MAKNNYKKYTKSDDDVILLNYDNCSTKELAEMLGRTTRSVYHRVNKLKDSGRLVTQRKTRKDKGLKKKAQPAKPKCETGKALDIAPKKDVSGGTPTLFKGKSEDIPKGTKEERLPKPVSVIVDEQTTETPPPVFTEPTPTEDVIVRDKAGNPVVGSNPEPIEDDMYYEDMFKESDSTLYRAIGWAIIAVISLGLIALGYIYLS